MICILEEKELAVAAGLSRYVFDNCVKYRMEFAPTIQFVEDYLAVENLRKLYLEEKLLLWGVYERDQLVAVSAMTNEGMVTMLYVLPNCFRKGYGMNLLKTMREYAYTTLGLEYIRVNATPAWTAVYFKKQGFSFVEKNQNMRVPFVPMVCSTKMSSLQQKRHVPGRIIAAAALGCVAFALVAGVAFMMWYVS